MPDRTRSAELAALTAIAAQVNCTQDLDEILSGALETTLEVVGEDSGEIFLVDDETGELILHTHQGLSEAFVADEAVLGPGECLCGLAVRLAGTGRDRRYCSPSSPQPPSLPARGISLSASACRSWPAGRCWAC